MTITAPGSDEAERVHALEAHDARLAAIVHAVKLAVISVDEAQNIVLFNPEAESLFRCPAAEALGGPLDRFIPVASRVAHRALVTNYGGSSERGARSMGGERILTGLRADGEEFPIDASITATEVGDQKLYTVILRDVTERKRMEAELQRLLHEQRQAEALVRESRDRLRELSSALQTVREEEKTRIARELHDELGQALTALKMDTVAIASELDPAQVVLRKRTEGMKQIIDGTVSSVRRIAADLRPVMLDNLGLVPTLEWLASEFSRRTNIRAALHIPDENLGVSGDAATAIFRIVQEALTNVARHSGADEVAIEVRRGSGSVTVTIRDNGRGFSEPDTRKARSFGLLGMRERAYVLGGEFKISRLAHKGTQIEAVIPAFGTAGTGQGRSS
jgi:two-component system sensor kinase